MVRCFMVPLNGPLLSALAIATAAFLPTSSAQSDSGSQSPAWDAGNADWCLELTDSYGDGLNGATVTLAACDGTVNEEYGIDADGFNDGYTATFCKPHPGYDFSLAIGGGYFDYEIGWTLVSPGAVVEASGGAGTYSSCNGSWAEVGSADGTNGGSTPGGSTPGPPPFETPQCISQCALTCYGLLYGIGEGMGEGMGDYGSGEGMGQGMGGMGGMPGGGCISTSSKEWAIRRLQPGAPCPPTTRRKHPPWRRVGRCWWSSTRC